MPAALTAPDDGIVTTGGGVKRSTTTLLWSHGHNRRTGDDLCEVSGGDLLTNRGFERGLVVEPNVQGEDAHLARVEVSGSGEDAGALKRGDDSTTQLAVLEDFHVHIAGKCLHLLEHG